MQGLRRMLRLPHLLRRFCRQDRLSQLGLLPPRAAPGSGRARKSETGGIAGCFSPVMPTPGRLGNLSWIGVWRA
eukprot:5442536-Pyramimonas_sp.AAC.1